MRLWIPFPGGAFRMRQVRGGGAGAVGVGGGVGDSAPPLPATPLFCVVECVTFLTG